MNRIKMVNDNVLIVPAPNESVTPGGLFIEHLEPEGGVRRGTVRAADGDHGDLLDQEVMYVQYGATDFNHEGIDCYLVKAANILAVLG